MKAKGKWTYSSSYSEAKHELGGEEETDTQKRMELKNGGGRN